MCGRIGEVRPYGNLHLAECLVGIAAVRAYYGKSADSLVVEAEVLGEGVCDNELLVVLLESPYSCGILLEPLGESLIGEVEERQKAVLCGELSEGLPLLC